MSWMSHKLRRLYRSVGVADVLACAVAILESQISSSTFLEILCIQIAYLIVALDLRDLFRSLPMQRNSVDKSIHAKVSGICYDYETKNVDKMVETLGGGNLSDPEPD